MEVLTQILVALFVVTTMFGVGLALGVRDVAASLRDRAWLARALFANLVVLPLVALGVCRLLQLDPVLTTAMMVLATAPGGPALVKLAALAKGDAALAVGLVVTLLLVGVVTQPIVLPLLASGVTVSAWAIARTLLLMVATPLLMGLTVRARQPRLASRLLAPMQRASTISMVLVLLLIPAGHWRELGQMAGSGAFPAALLFIVLAAGAGWLLGGAAPGQRQMLALSTAQPNMAAAFIIAKQNLHDPRAILMLLVTVTCSLAILLPLALCLGRFSRAAVAGISRQTIERGGQPNPQREEIN